jgi:hypothetical protein
MPRFGEEQLGDGRGSMISRIWGRRIGLVALVVGVTLVGAGCVEFTGSKVITGGESEGPFTVRIACVNEGVPTSQDLTLTGEGTATTLPFLLLAGPNATCTITEPETAGATNVTFECGEIGITHLDMFGGVGAGGPGMVVSGNGPAEEATCTETADGLQVDIALAGIAEVDVSFTVTNDFTPVTPPTTTPPTTIDPGAAQAAAPVTAAPTFTG